MIEERRQKLVFSRQQFESRHQIDPGHGVDHLERKQDTLGPWFLVLAVVSIAGGTQAQIQAERPVNDLGPFANKLFENAFEKTTDIPCGKPVSRLSNASAQQILGELRRVKRRRACGEFAVLRTELRNRESRSWRNQPGCTRPAGTDSEATRSCLCEEPGWLWSALPRSSES